MFKCFSLGSLYILNRQKNVKYFYMSQSLVFINIFIHSFNTFALALNARYWKCSKNGSRKERRFIYAFLCVLISLNHNMILHDYTI